MSESRLGQVGTKKRPRKSNKPETLKDRVLARRAAGASYRQIARAEGISKNTVPTILAEKTAALEAYRDELRSTVPLALEQHKRILRKGDPAHVRWTLEATQVGVKREEREVEQRQSILAGRTREEKLFFATHGHWPEQKETNGQGQETSTEEQTHVHQR